MALNDATEEMVDGFVRDKDTGALVVTSSPADATETGGFLRDPDGRLVVTSG